MKTLGTGGIRSLYFAYFAFVGLFSPYLSLWLDWRGLTIGEIAVLMALPQLLRIVAPRDAARPRVVDPLVSVVRPSDPREADAAIARARAALAERVSLGAATAPRECRP